MTSGDVELHSAPTLAEDPNGPYALSPVGWWSENGGGLDEASGVVYLPPGASIPACQFPCSQCESKGRQ